LQKIQHFAKNNPEISNKLYDSINAIYNEEISNQETKSSSSQGPKIKNPLVVKSKGRPAKKRIKSSLEKEKVLKKRRLR
jgi:hypothetical protein